MNSPDQSSLASAIFDGLNPAQREAVETTEGPVLVLAGAGSGKTRVLTSRIAYLIGVLGIPAEQILAVTFTNKAAGEMKERVEKLLGPAASEISIGTFHSIGVRILRREIGHLARSRGFVIYDDTDSIGVIKDVLKREGRSEGSRATPHPLANRSVEERRPAPARRGRSCQGSR